MALTYIVKAFDTCNNKLLITIIGKYGAPPRLMYNKSIVKLIIRKLEKSVDLKLDVKQGEKMAPLIFMFLMMAFTEILEAKLMALGLSKAQFSRKEN